MSRIAVVLNPHALGVRRAPGLADRLRAVLDGDGEVVVTHTPAELADAVGRFAQAAVPLVATCGGDGTNLSTLTAMVRAWNGAPLPTFAILRGGTVNTIAENLGVRGRPHEILERLVAGTRAGTLPTLGQDLLCVNGLYGFLFASLMGARFLEAYYAGPRPGPAWATALALRTAGSSLVRGHFARRLFAPTELELTIDGEPVAAERCRLLVASTVRDVGIGMKVAWQAGRHPGRFHLVASGLSTTSMALQLHRVLGGRPLAGGPHVDRLATRARVRFAEEQPYTLDGDLFRARELEVSIGPRIAVAQV